MTNNEILVSILTQGNTCATTLYALKDKDTDCILNYKNKYVFTTREQARLARRNLASPKRKIIIVKTDFINVKGWEETR